MTEATLVITTKNRRHDLQRALRSAEAQTCDLELLVIDDGSQDGTSEMVRREFPRAKLIRHERSGGLIRRRNEGAAAASGKVIFSLDDDAEFSTPHTAAQTLAEFDNDRVGAVAIPYIDVQRGPQVKQLARSASGVLCRASYVGTAHAVRRDLFEACGGYREEIFHQGEERDLCIRLLERGYVVRAGRADPIHHHESPIRDSRRMDVYGRRNDILFAWENVPAWFLPWQLAGTTLKGGWYALRTKTPHYHLWGFCRGYASIPRYWSRRQAVSSRTYRLYRRLVAADQLPLDEVLAVFQA